MTRTGYWTGVVIALFAALCFSATSVSAVIAMKNGANPSALILLRFAGAILILTALLRLAGIPILLNRRTAAAAALLAVAQVLQSFFLVTAYDRIPVGLATVLFYLFPLLVGVTSTMLGQERLTLPLSVGLVVAFAGLMLVFGATGEGLQFTGALFAVAAAASWTIVVVALPRLIGSGDPRPVLLTMQVSAFVLFGCFLLIFGGAELPANRTGWIAFFMVPLGYAVAITSYFTAIGMIGTVRASFAMNFEGVSAIGLGFLALGQVLRVEQLAGAGLVILALFALRWRPGRQAE